MISQRISVLSERISYQKEYYDIRANIHVIRTSVSDPRTLNERTVEGKWLNAGDFVWQFLLISVVPSDNYPVYKRP